MRIKSLVVSAVMALASATSGSAATVDVGGTKYEVSFITTSFAASTSTLTDQIWWGDQTLANTFAAAVAGTLGLPNSTTRGPYFAYSAIVTSRPRVTASYFDSASGTVETDTGLSGTSNIGYAVASVAAVPVPAAGLLLLAAFGPLAALKRRKKRAA